MAQKPRILFVCIENACRSQMAEAFARHYGGDRIDAQSAGSKPRGQVDAHAIAVMKEHGVDLSRHASKGLSTFPNVQWDVVVGMGCGDACPSHRAKRVIQLEIPNPKDQPIEVVRQIRNQIESRVKELLSTL